MDELDAKVCYNKAQEGMSAMTEGYKKCSLNLNSFVDNNRYYSEEELEERKHAARIAVAKMERLVKRVQRDIETLNHHIEKNEEPYPEWLAEILRE